jgi:hypothetical protein
LEDFEDIESISEAEGELPISVESVGFKSEGIGLGMSRGSLSSDGVVDVLFSKNFLLTHVSVLACMELRKIMHAL